MPFLYRFIIIFIILLNYNSYAQWQSVYETPKPLTSIALFDNSEVIAGGIDIMIKTNNYGADWIECVGLPEAYVVNDIDFLSSDTTYAILSAVGAIYYSYDGGESWLLFPDLFTSAILDLDVINGSISYATDISGNFYKTNDNFENLNFYHLSSYFLYSLDFIGVDTGYIAAFGDGLLKTENAGVEWVQTFPYPVTSPRKVSFVSASTGFITDYSYLAKTTDYGTSWTSIELPEFLNLEDFYFVNDSVGYIAGQEGLEGIGVIYKTIDGGGSWIKNNILPECGIATKIVCQTTDTCYCLTSNGFDVNSFILKTTNGGGINTYFGNPNLQNGFSISPNPSSDVIRILLNSTDQTIDEIITRNLSGEKIRINWDKSLQADIKNLPPGIYFTEIISEDTRLLKKWMKTN